MFESTKRFIRDEIYRQLRMGAHKTFYSFLMGVSFPMSIDETVDHLLNATKELQIKVNQLESEIRYINTHYRDFLCGDCCHQDVCKIKDTVKYGYECEDKACPELLEIEDKPLEEIKPIVFKEDTE